MSKYICEYCNKEYSCQSNLINHKKKAKFCLRLRNSSNIHKYKCNYCDEEFKYNGCLSRHYNICKIKKEKDYDENDIKKDDLILTLQNELRILMSETYPERENNLKDEINSYKTEVLVLKEQLKLKDEQHKKELKMKDEIINILECAYLEMKDEFINTLQEENTQYTNNTNNSNNTIINIQITKELLDKMMIMNKLNDNIT